VYEVLPFGSAEITKSRGSKCPEKQTKRRLPGAAKGLGIKDK